VECSRTLALAGEILSDEGPFEGEREAPAGVTT